MPAMLHLKRNQDWKIIWIMWHMKMIPIKEHILCTLFGSSASVRCNFLSSHLHTSELIIFTSDKADLLNRDTSRHTMQEHIHESEFSIHSPHSAYHNQHIKLRFKVNLKGAKKDITRTTAYAFKKDLYTQFIIVLKRRYLLYLYLIYQLTLPISHKREPTRRTSSCPPCESLNCVWFESVLWAETQGETVLSAQACGTELSGLSVTVNCHSDSPLQLRQARCYLFSTVLYSGPRTGTATVRQ